MHTDGSSLPSSRKIKFMAIGIPCLLILYVLSLGPMARLSDEGCIGDQTGKLLMVVYAPLALLAPVPGADRIFKWYVFDVWHCDRNGDIS
jgi:hypothetical protein